MKPLEPGCLAIIIKGDDTGTTVTCHAKYHPPLIVDAYLHGQLHRAVEVTTDDVCTEGPVWAISGNLSGEFLELHIDTIVCNWLVPEAWLMRIDGLDIDDKCIVGNSLKTTIERLV